MGISIYWDDAAHTCVRFGFVKHWNWNNLFQALDFVESLSKREGTIIDLILDLRAADPLPSQVTLNLNILNRAKQFITRVNGMPNAIVLLGGNAVIRSMYRTFETLHPTQTPKIHFCNELSEAQAICSEQRLLRSFLETDDPTESTRPDAIYVEAAPDDETIGQAAAVWDAGVRR